MIPAFGQFQFNDEISKIWRSLNEQNQQSLLAFARFLQNHNETPQAEAITEINPIPRPEDESVIKAIKRLRQSYPMVNPDHLLPQVSELMTSHIISGKEANEIIDELEELFLENYRKLASSTGETAK